ncbi:Protein tesmin/TSO1-like CXC 2 [Apostasia shenzhenica]|uniref:Protein tesmin/TSO1-like CXC 2 n=1 Tax=Apostasia shenzhenica TaxID=1088818 RepID=A0A2I0BAZ3_9ASPA|nr:Protein tesmin/TSO1-like CXC 2 [Apostasia shenzhenica]
MHCTNGSPTHNDRPLCGIKFDFESDISSRTSELVQFVQDGLGNKNNLVSSEISLNVNIQEDQKKNVASGCDWKNLASADDLIILDKEMIEKNHNSISLNTQPNASFSICIQNNPDDSLVDNDGKAGEQPGMNRAAKLLSDNSFHQEKFSEQNQKADAGVTACVYLGCKINSQPARGMRRRCLVFEASGNSERNLRNDSTAIPPITLLTKERPTSDDQLLASSNPCLLPGIGLHLNALASSSKDKLYFPENKIPVREIICKPCSGCPFPPAEVGEKSKIFELEQTTDPLGREAEDFQVVHSDVLQTPAPPVEESTCPRKKSRRKIGNGSDSEGCKNCCCKKSKCLKLYCECFAAGTYCVEPCLCQGCFNKPIHEEIVLATRKQIESRNPLAFAPKVIRTFEDGQDMEEETNKTPASARHKKGCNCKKSNCLKKYCECYQGGVGCSSSCRCESCRNTFGRKDGVDEVECDGEIVDCAKVKLNEGQNNADIPKIEGCHLSEGTLAKTLFLTSRLRSFFCLSDSPYSFY